MINHPADPKFVSPSEIVWQALEYKYSKKHPNWYWTVGIGGGLLALAAVFFKNFFLAIIFVLAAFTMMLYASRPPAMVSFAVSSRGVRIGNRLYPYSALESFWVVDEPGKKKVIVESKKTLMPHIILPLDEVADSEKIRQYLKEFLPEEHHEETLSDLLTDALDF